MHPEIFTVHFRGEPYSLHTYGVMIATGFLFAMYLGSRRAEREGEDPDRIMDLAFWVLLWGLIGSRILFVFTKLDDYMRDPIEIFRFWRGGLVFYGGFITAAIYVFHYSRKNKLNAWKFADISIPYVAMAHAFGRFGCVAAGCCFGKPTDAWWGIVFPEGSMAHAAHSNQGLISFGESALPIHPTQLYEAGFELCMFLFLILLRNHKRFHGQIFLTWLAIYPIARSIIETFRGDTERGVWAFGLSTSQYISIAVAGFSVWAYFYLRKKRMASLPVPTTT